MKSSSFITKTICTISLDPADVQEEDIGIDVLEIVRKNKVSNVIVDLAQLELITSQVIHFINKLVNVLKLNNVHTIVCGFNVYSASIIFHFIDEISFETTLNVQSALDAIENK